VSRGIESKLLWLNDDHAPAATALKAAGLAVDEKIAKEVFTRK
jgi:hypothetical protein